MAERIQKKAMFSSWQGFPKVACSHPALWKGNPGPLRQAAKCPLLSVRREWGGEILLLEFLDLCGL